MTDLPTIDAARLLSHIRTLASDEFGGRAPGSAGEALTVEYLSKHLAEAGARPGNPDGTWVQHVPLVSITPSDFTPLTIAAAGRGEREFAFRHDFIAFSKRVVDSVAVTASDLVFVGYGVQAPEYGWDDYKGLDVRGKTLIILVNDPPVPLDPARPDELDPAMFNGRAMTYYGRWTCKFEKAAELGAAAAFVVHETGPAGYPFSVVQGMAGERFDLVSADRNMGRSAIEGWLSLEAATAILTMAGLDLATLKAEARTREFRPHVLRMHATLAFRQTLRTVDSRNVVAKIPGADPAVRDECVIYTAHWDHLGIGAPIDGDAIYHGARDNASGVGMLIEIARAFARVQPAPRRTIVLLSVTAEEHGLLGSEYYATSPLYPLSKTLAAINIDELNIWGPTRDLTIIGLGASDLDAYAREAAAELGRTLRPDAEPEKGFYFRSDHFNFAKVGVPAMNPDSGVEFIGKPPEYAAQIREEWIRKYYHRPADKVDDWWDLSGAIEEGRLLFSVGYRVANATAFPQWSQSSEFRAVRERSLENS